MLLSSLRQTNFNPRSDERSDLPPSYRSPAHLISIHAPTNGATQRAFEREHTRTISIHAPTNGATEIQELKPQTIIFQSTLRRTERRCFSWNFDIGVYDFNPRSDERSNLLLLLSSLRQTNFNPRSDERSDLPPSYRSPAHLISIHAPTNGATQRAFEREHTRTISIHAPTNGATEIQELKPQTIIFQSTLRRTERHSSNT